jgi:hypothetical protein
MIYDGGLINLITKVLFETHRRSINSVGNVFISASKAYPKLPEYDCSAWPVRKDNLTNGSGKPGPAGIVERLCPRRIHPKGE